MSIRNSAHSVSFSYTLTDLDQGTKSLDILDVFTIEK